MAATGCADSLAVAIARYDTVATEQVCADVDGIFFASSGTRDFVSITAKAEFRERWLGRYLEAGPQHAFVALTAAGRAIGYLVGAIDDPALDDRYGDIGYFRILARETARYPAHLHVNLTPEYRGRRIGERLVTAFAEHAAAHGAPGVHVVTVANARNVGFYDRCGFVDVRQFCWADRRLVMLGRLLLPTVPPPLEN